MRAIHLTHFQEPGEIQVSDIPKPEIERGEALVRVKAAGLNPSDVKNAQGVMKHHTTLPRTLGRDYAGIVEEGPAEWIGKGVWGSGGDLGFSRDGTFAEYISVPAASLSEKPSTLSFEAAAGAGIPFITAYSGLVRLCEGGRGEWLLIVGASGSVGAAVAQLGNWLGMHVIGTMRTSEDHPSAEMRTVNLEKENLAEAVKHHSRGAGADVCFNVVGGETFQPSLDSLAIHGRMVCIAATGDPHVSLNLLDFYRHQLKLYGLDTLQMDAVACAEVLEMVKPGFQSGDLKLEEPQRFRLENAAEAFSRVAHGETGRKVFVL